MSGKNQTVFGHDKVMPNRTRTRSYFIFGHSTEHPGELPFIYSNAGKKIFEGKKLMPDHMVRHLALTCLQFLHRLDQCSILLVEVVNPVLQKFHLVLRIINNITSKRIACAASVSTYNLSTIGVSYASVSIYSMYRSTGAAVLSP